jgi:hypothetical protein
MKLGFAFLADAADIRDDGQFSVVGGGFDQLRASTFPAIKHAMALVGRIEFEPEEIGKNFSLHCEIVGPDEIAIPPELWLSLGPFPADPNRANWATICFNYQGVSFPKPGDYFVQLSVDKKILGSVRISVRQTGEPQ